MEFRVGLIVLQGLKTGTMEFAPELIELSERGTLMVGHLRPPDQHSQGTMFTPKS